jgi:lipoprotein LprG
MPNRARRAPAAVTVALTVVLSAVVGGCSGDDGSSSDDRTPEEVMELAAKNLDETSGVSFELSAEDVPEGETVLKAATGVGTNAPAFEGDITVVLSGADFDVPVVAVDGKVYAQLPLTTGFSVVDPAEYGAPDPARLMSSEDGFSTLLPATEGLEKGETVRGGEDNKEVLTEYTGTVSGEQVANIIPSAEGEFDATYTVSDDGELRRAVLTGVFYPDTEPMTYTVDIDDYGTDQEITAP